MMDSSHYGMGLNLQMTTHIIIYHRMTKELEQQIIGRGHRLGRTKPLSVVYLINGSESDQTTY